jgi:hypothetical protein
MTGGNLAFPSGNAEPTTIEDWDYMLPLMKQYFESAGLVDYACLIIPATGYFANGALLEGYGIGGTDYVDQDGKVQYGIAQDKFYDYLVKIKNGMMPDTFMVILPVEPKIYSICLIRL